MTRAYSFTVKNQSIKLQDEHYIPPSISCFNDGDDPKDQPPYTGGFTYEKHNLTFMAHRHRGAAADYNGLLQESVLGTAFAINYNYILFTYHGQYQPQ